jgi:hypothetical protein
MKKIVNSLSIILFLFLFNSLNAKSIIKIKPFDANNDTLTVTFKVNGNPVCESNIESVLNTQNGIISANWNSQSKLMTVVFKSNIIKNSDLYTILALAGYDSSELRAKQSAYDSLSNECKYSRDPETE